jgi:hypothetical protein
VKTVCTEEVGVKGRAKKTSKKEQRRIRAQQQQQKASKKKKNADALTGSLLLQRARMRTRKRDKDGR